MLYNLRIYMCQSIDLWQYWSVFLFTMYSYTCFFTVIFWELDCLEFDRIRKYQTVYLDGQLIVYTQSIVIILKFHRKNFHRHELYNSTVKWPYKNGIFLQCTYIIF